MTGEDLTPVLDALLSSASALVRVAGAVEGAATQSVRIYLNPFHADVVCHDAHGIVRSVFRTPGAPALAKSSATFLNAGLR